MTMKLNAKVLAATCAAITLSAGLVACSSDSGSTGGSGDSAGGDNIITAYGCEPQNPLVSTNTNEACGGQILDALFSGLVKYNEDGTTTNAVAESITPNDDATEFTIKLKEDWTFHNGESVDADSFINAWSYGAKGANAQLQQYFYEPFAGYEEISGEDSEVDTLSGLEKISDYEFKVTLNAPEADFPLRLGYAAYYPLPQAFFDDPEAFGENPVGNGPYQLAEEGTWQHNVGLDTVVYEDFKGDTPANDGVNFIFYQTLETAYADLQSGRLDSMYTLPTSALATFKTDFPNSHDSKSKMVSQTFVVPPTVPGFGWDEEGYLRRQALSLAFDRQLIIDTIFQGEAVPATDWGVPTLPGVLELEGGEEAFAYDPERARELWAEADAINPWSGTFELAYNADGGHQQWAEAVTNGIAQTLGIEAQGKAYPIFKALRDEVTNKTITTAFRSGWQGDYPSLANFLEPQYSTTGSANDADFSNPEFDALLRQASSETDTAAAQELYKQAQQMLLVEFPSIPMWVPNASYAWNEDVTGVTMLWNGTFDYTTMTKN